MSDARPCHSPIDTRPPVWPPIGPWFGTTTTWRVPLEREARRRYGDALTVVQRGRRLTYHLDGLVVPGRQDPVSVAIEFHADARLDDYGLDPADYPRVYADSGKTSKHRLADDSLCLYNPADPPERRWRADLGLQCLIELAIDHLFAEQFWRDTGGPDGGEWLLDEAPHGYNPPPPARAPATRRARKHR